MLLELHLFVLYKVGPALAHCSSEAAFVNQLFTEKEDAEFLSGHYGNLASSSLQGEIPKKLYRHAPPCDWHLTSGFGKLVIYPGFILGFGKRVISKLSKISVGESLSVCL